MDDFYKTLGVEKTATPDEIKSAYRKLASKHHPDKGGDTATFQKIQAAYETLSDANKRADYDNPMPQSGGFHFHQGGGIPPGFEDIFASMFGGGNPFGDLHRRPQQRNSTVSLQTSISLEEAFTGKEIIAGVRLPSGREQAINVKIPAGISDGTTIRLKELGDDSIPSIPKGDINLTVRVAAHKTFMRQGDDLIKEVTLSAFEAMLGTSIEVDTLDGKTLNITVQPGTQHGAVLGAQGYGMPNVNDNRFKGRLLIPIKISIPTNLTDAQKELIKQAMA